MISSPKYNKTATITQVDSDQILQDRGIAKTAHEANWQAIGNVWHYPVYAPNGATIATRTKRISGNGAKYLWIPIKPNNPDADIYILPGTVSAIQDMDGVCLLENGEVSLLTMHEAGIHNAICTTMGETSIPKQAIEYLQNLGITTLIQHVDNDDAGMQGAIKWRDALHDTEITYQPMSWGLDAKSGYDSNDAWIDCQFNADGFKARLDNLKPLLLPAHEKPVIHNYNDADFDKTPSGLFDAIASELHIKSWRGEWCKNVSSPLREDKHPSFGINRDGVGYDFATGESYSPTEVAEALGIDWRAFYPKRTTSRKSRHNQGLDNAPIQSTKPDKKPVIFSDRFVDTEQFYGANGLPQWHIAGLSIATGGKSSIGLIADALIRATVSGELPALDDNYSVDIKTLAKTIGISRPKLAKYLPQLIELSIVKEAFVQLLTPNSLSTIGVNSYTKGSKPVRGASKSYQINLSKDITGFILEAIRYRLTEQKFKGSSAPLDDLMAMQIGVNEDTHNQYGTVYDATIDVKISKPKLDAIQKEMTGNGTWPGWNTVLTDSSHDTFMDDMPKTMGAWRIATMKRLIKINPERNRTEWMRHLGTLSQGTVKNTRDNADLKSIVNRPYSDVKRITADDRRDESTLKTVVMSELAHVSKELQGRAISANLQVKYHNEPINVSLFDGKYQDTIEKYRDVITGISFIVQTASKYVPLTEDEVEEIAQNKANKQAEKDANMNTVEPTIEPVIEDEKEVTLSHPVTEYDPAFIRQSVSKLYETVTGHKPPSFATSKDIVLSTIAHYEAQQNRSKSA